MEGKNNVLTNESTVQEVKEKKPIFKKWWFWVIIAVALIIIIGVAFGGSGDGSADSGTTDANAASGTIDPTGNNTVSDIVEYEIYNVFKTEKLTAPVGGSFSYSPDSGKEFIVVAMNVKNLRSETTMIEDLISTSLKVNGKDYAGTDYALSDNDTSIDSWSSIDALETKKVYFAFSVEKGVSTDGMVLTTTVDGKSSSTPVSISEYESKKENFVINKEITDGETLSATVEKVYYTNIIEPTNPDDYYRYYEAESGKTYLALKVKVKNLKGEDLQCEDVAGVKCTYNGKYEYTASSCVEEEEGSDLTYTNITSIAPLDTTVMYYFMEIPKDAEGGDMEVEMYILGQPYYYTVK